MNKVALLFSAASLLLFAACTDYQAEFDDAFSGLDYADGSGDQIPGSSDVQNPESSGGNEPGISSGKTSSSNDNGKSSSSGVNGKSSSSEKGSSSSTGKSSSSVEEESSSSAKWSSSSITFKKTQDKFALHL